MHSFILLLKVQLLGLFGINKALHADAAKAKQKLALLALAVLAIVVVVAAYSAGMAQGLVQLGLADAIPLVAVLVGSVAGAVVAFLKANGVLFAFKDYDLVMSLPVPISAVVLSRIVPLYAMSVAIGLLAMVPALCVYASVAGVTALSVAFMALSVVLAPLLPLALAIVLAALIAAVSSRFRRSSIVMTALSVVAVVALVAGSLAFSGQSGDVEALGELGAQAMSQMAGVFPPAAWAAEGIAHGDAALFALFAGASLAAGAVLLAVLVRLFVPVNSMLMSSRLQGTFSFESPAGLGTGAQARSPFRALVVKEARLVLATPIYLLNTCIGYVLVLVASVAALAAHLLGVLSIDSLALNGMPDVELSIVGFLPWVLAFGFGISSTSAPSVSLEGSSRWLMLTAPVPARTVLGAKAALNLLLAGPTLAIAAVSLSIAFSLDAVTVAAMVVVPGSFALFATFFGLFLDARRPRYDWTSVYEPVKRGLPVMGTVLGGMALTAAGMAVSAVAGTAASMAVALVVGVVSVALFRTTVKRGLFA